VHPSDRFRPDPKTPPLRPYRDYLKPKDVTGNGRSRRHACPRSNVETYKAVEKLPDEAVREAVLRAVPRRRERYLRGLHLLAAHLKRLDPSAGAWEEALRVWFFLSQPVAPAWRWGWVRTRFAAAFSVAKSPTAKLDKVAAGSVDAWRADKGSWGYWSPARRVEAVLAALGRKVGAVFFASVRDVARWAHVAPATAGRVLAKMIAAGTVRVVADSRPNPFTRDARTFDVSPMLALSGRPNEAADNKTPLRPAFLSPDPVQGFREEVLTSCVSPLEILGEPLTPNRRPPGPDCARPPRRAAHD
jgi:hypothetical protein